MAQTGHAERTRGMLGPPGADAAVLDCWVAVRGLKSVVEFKDPPTVTGWAAFDSVCGGSPELGLG